MSYRIILDAGHGGFDSGAVYKGRKEKDDCLRLALEVGDKLVQYGLQVAYTRTIDVYRNANERVHIANHSEADLLISLHRNVSPYPNTYRGVETNIFNSDNGKENYAENINKSLSKVGFRDLGVNERQDIPLLKYTTMPALLIEVGYIHSNCDNDIFDEYFEDVANALTKGIMASVNELDAEEILKY